jgi:hypothetical protein
MVRYDMNDDDISSPPPSPTLNEPSPDINSGDESTNGGSDLAVSSTPRITRSTTATIGAGASAGAAAKSSDSESEGIRTRDMDAKLTYFRSVVVLSVVSKTAKVAEVQLSITWSKMVHWFFMSSTETSTTKATI